MFSFGPKEKKPTSQTIPLKGPQIKNVEKSYDDCEYDPSIEIKASLATEEQKKKSILKRFISLFQRAPNVLPSVSQEHNKFTITYTYNGNDKNEKCIAEKMQDAIEAIYQYLGNARYSKETNTDIRKNSLNYTAYTQEWFDIYLQYKPGMEAPSIEHIRPFSELTDEEYEELRQHGLWQEVLDFVYDSDGYKSRLYLIAALEPIVNAKYQYFLQPSFIELIPGSYEPRTQLHIVFKDINDTQTEPRNILNQDYLKMKYGKTRTQINTEILKGILRSMSMYAQQKINGTKTGGTNIKEAQKTNRLLEKPTNQKPTNKKPTTPQTIKPLPSILSQAPNKKSQSLKTLNASASYQNQLNGAKTTNTSRNAMSFQSKQLTSYNQLQALSMLPLENKILPFSVNESMFLGENGTSVFVEQLIDIPVEDVVKYNRLVNRLPVLIDELQWLDDSAIYKLDKLTDFITVNSQSGGNVIVDDVTAFQKHYEQLEKFVRLVHEENVKKASKDASAMFVLITQLVSSYENNDISETLVVPFEEGQYGGVFKDLVQSTLTKYENFSAKEKASLPATLLKAGVKKCYKTLRKLYGVRKTKMELKHKSFEQHILEHLKDISKRIEKDNKTRGVTLLVTDYLIYTIQVIQGYYEVNNPSNIQTINEKIRDNQDTTRNGLDSLLEMLDTCRKYLKNREQEDEDKLKSTPGGLVKVTKDQLHEHIGLGKKLMLKIKGMFRVNKVVDNTMDELIDESKDLTTISINNERAKHDRPINMAVMNVTSVLTEVMCIVNSLPKPEQLDKKTITNKIANEAYKEQDSYRLIIDALSKKDKDTKIKGLKDVAKQINLDNSFLTNVKLMANIGLQVTDFTFGSICEFANIAVDIGIDVSVNFATPIPGLSFAISGVTYITMSMLSMIVKIPPKIKDYIEEGTVLRISSFVQEVLKNIDKELETNNRERCRFGLSGGTRKLAPQGRLFDLWVESDEQSISNANTNTMAVVGTSKPLHPFAQKYYNHLAKSIKEIFGNKVDKRTIEGALGILYVMIDSSSENLPDQLGGRLSKKHKAEITSFLNTKKRQELHDYCKLKGVKFSKEAKKEDYIKAIIDQHKKNKRALKSKSKQ